MTQPAKENETKTNPLQEIIQPFIDLIKAPRALWGIYLPNIFEGMVYFGILGYLSLYFSDFIFKGVERPNEHAHNMVMCLTAGITVSMLFLGSVTDKRGVRFALIWSFVLLLIGRVLLSTAPTLLALKPTGAMWSPLHWVTMLGILIIVAGYGMYQPATYAAIRQFTTPKTSAAAFAMIYATMNLGGFFPFFAFLLRDEKFLGLGFPGTFSVYTFFTFLALVLTCLLLTRKTVDDHLAQVKAETAESPAEKNSSEKKEPVSAAGSVAARVPWHMWIFVAALLVALYLKVPTAGQLNIIVAAVVGVVWIVLALLPATARFLANHPLADKKFFFFIFALIPVQTLFTYNWLVLPAYIQRAFSGAIGEYFEMASNFNPILIFFLCPIIASLTAKRNVYNMMILGTLVMAAPAFLLVLGPTPVTLFSYIVLMTVGEAMWQPRFLQYAAEIAPEGRTGQYMGVSQLPWFLTKVLVPWLYSGKMMDLYCPETGPKNTEFMWLIFGCIAICSTILLLVAKGWLGKDFKTKA